MALFWKAISPTGCRHGEHDVEVGYRQQFGLSHREPLDARQPLAFGTVTVATRVVSDARRAAIIALLDMTPERRRPPRLQTRLRGKALRIRLSRWPRRLLAGSRTRRRLR